MKESRTIHLFGRDLIVFGDENDPYFNDANNFPRDVSPISLFMKNSLRKDSICVDAGANIGVITLLMATLAPDGHVFAFEAGATNAYRLRRNIEANGLRNCTAINTALGHQACGTVNFVESRAWGSVVPDDAPSTGRVPVTSLDAYFLQQPPTRRVDVLKIDTEGFEPLVLAGASDLIRRDNPTIVMEFNSIAFSTLHHFEPYAVAKAIWHEFDVFSVDPSGDLRPLPDPRAFLHANMSHGCVDDLVIRLKAGRSPEALLKVTSPPADLLARAEALRTELNAVYNSTSWKITAPLRALRRALPH